MRNLSTAKNNKLHGIKFSFQRLKPVSPGQEISALIEPEGSSPRSQEPATGQCSEAVGLNPI
jgi:hypothetical protein